MTPTAFVDGTAKLSAGRTGCSASAVSHFRVLAGGIGRCGLRVASTAPLSASATSQPRALRTEGRPGVPAARVDPSAVVTGEVLLDGFESCALPAARAGAAARTVGIRPTRTI